jgi:hypothetical protein
MGSKTSAPRNYWRTIGYLPYALRRRFGYVRAPNAILDVWVVSPGGVGTTALMKHVSQFKRINAPDDSDSLKHLPRPLRLANEGDIRFLFISGPEDEIYNSLKRRGWLEDQAANLGAPLAVLLRGRMQKWALLRAVRRQRHAWEREAPKHMLSLDYRDLFEAGPTLAEYFGIADRAFVADYPQRKQRAVSA